LYDRHILEPPGEWVRAWKPEVPGIHEVFHARFLDHAYPPHTHDTWTVFVVDDGAIRYDLETKHRGAAGARVTILPPYVVHDGRAASADGYRKRVLYVGTEVLGEALIGPAVDEPDIDDRSVVRGVNALHRALEQRYDPFETESLVAVVCSRLREHLGGRVTEPTERSGRAIAEAFRDLLDAHRFGSMTLAESGRILHVSPAHLIRCFAGTFGISPHRYLVGRRIDAARQLLLEGESPAQVAVEVGFHDQAHLTRHFRRHVGTTPGRYSTSVRLGGSSERVGCSGR